MRLPTKYICAILGLMEPIITLSARLAALDPGAEPYVEPFKDECRWSYLRQAARRLKQRDTAKVYTVKRVGETIEVRRMS